MDWRSIRFDWNHARAFLVVAEEGSLTAAAKALGVSQPTLGRQVASLESALGVALFERGTRGLELTPNGLRLAEYVQGMGEAASQLSLVASGQSQAIEGSVCISTNEMEAVLVMPDLLRRLREEEPGIDVEIIASQSASDLKRREADIAIRGFRPTQPDLIARRLPDQENYLYASSGYLDSIGRPQTVEGFSGASFIGFNRTAQLQDVYQTIGLTVAASQFVYLAENHMVHWGMIRAGLGIGVMPAIIGDAEIGVERIFPALPPFVGEVWLVSHRELRTSRRVRRVFDFLAEALGAQPAR